MPQYHFTHLRMAAIRRQKITSVDEDVEKSELSYAADGNVP
jgi:hypothetical protein